MHNEGLFMSGSEDVKDYLRFLLDHNTECKKDGCISCLTLNNVCEQLRYHIFSGPLFPEIAIRSAASRAPALHQ
jgi:hypothetical protein